MTDDLDGQPGEAWRNRLNSESHLRAPALSPQLIGILAMSGAGFVFCVHDAITKYLAPHYPLSEIIFFRQLSSTILLLCYVQVTTGLGVLKCARPGLQALRSMLFVSSTFLIATSVSMLPLATALAIVFSSPLLVAALSTVTLGERVGPRRWLAIIVGFIGVLIIVRPADASFTWLLLIPVAAASASALRDISTRILHRSDSTNAILFWSNVAILATMPPTMLYIDWKPIAPAHVGILAVAGGLNLLAHFLTITALRFGDAALVTPFRYTSLVWAALIGYVVWNHFPDHYTIVGGAVIVAAGVYLVVRESQVRKAAVSERKA